MQRGIYRHYKGMEYLVFCFGKIEETGEEAVIYQALYDDYTIWIRPKSIFEEEVQVSEYSYQGPRFTFVRPWTKEDALKHSHAFAFPLFETKE